ncbi:hypothetical protein A6F68_00223 [Tsuneonella dongtanensis]|uniref:Uncharacterized protein n=1 Tax=Tsuneonella dongtanensis TaxID=692370 RepID=A0A1B2A9K8_9SPHN|nr:hypothetical protein [Tsuneonella dongtanensis]ANY18758.1 hypothetical protein A6F68_00223 [Tsuneonella dongtanensis]
MPTDPELAPELHNSEQDDEQSQAQTVAEQAQALRKGDPTASVKHDTTETPDLVDHMRDMEASGRIDMGAFKGEPSMDDDEDYYGKEPSDEEG